MGVTSAYKKLEITSKELRKFRTDFKAFAQAAWGIVDGSDLIWGWFLDLFCEELQKWGDADYRNLIISVPPGAGKSLFASVLLPAWMWLDRPSIQFLCCAHGLDLATRDNIRCRDLVRSEWYQDIVQGSWALKPDQDQKTRYQTTRHGSRQGIGGKSGLTGWRGDEIIIDDPLDLNPQKPLRSEDLDSAHAWVQYIRTQRVNDPKKSRMLLIAQRGHKDDPTGRLLRDDLANWHVICFDQEYDPAMPHRHPKDPRKRPGQLLFPERNDREQVTLHRIALGPEQYSAQHQQMPTIVGGNIVKESQIILIDDPHPNYDYILTSWDLAFKGGASSSWVVGTVWGTVAPDKLDNRLFDLLHVWRERVDYSGSKSAVEAIAMQWPHTTVHVVEDKANGPALVSELIHTIPNIYAFSPNRYGDKSTRLRAITPVISQGRMRVMKAEWTDQYLRELTSAPQCTDWDQVDSTTQAILMAQYHLKDWAAINVPRETRIFGGWDTTLDVW